MVLLGIGIGVKMKMDKKDSNLENQRTAAIGVKKIQPGVQKIHFTAEGGIDGGGDWSANAELVVNGKRYEEILTKDGLGVGDDLPEGNTGTTTPVKVVYSDKSEEVIK
ncbi:hypothetical protein FC90_GL000136 [Latilactobacillus graminis DSM 20719]|uniref:Uncharacterized protein n=1 Tax=Latilactobacillus graminis DSM 20719 TaxID=1423752 RepID=A0AA89I123_9LACO|nr:hypothetical protein FC90_GL000136 [Latilactobacillus graminis DSM 20719]